MIFSGDNITVKNINLMDLGLQGSALRQKVIADNIANVNTPGFKASDVYFENILSDCINKRGRLEGARTDGRHLKFGGVPSVRDAKPVIKTDASLIYRNDQSSVDIDLEMTKESKNTLYYNGVTTRLTDELRILSYIIQSGGKP